jgi:hypothetical protein
MVILENICLSKKTLNSSNFRRKELFYNSIGETQYIFLKLLFEQLRIAFVYIAAFRPCQDCLP